MNTDQIKQEQENQIRKCISCDGYNYKCEYNPNRHESISEVLGDKCIWYGIIDKEITLMVLGKKPQTFPILEQILREQI